MSIDHKFYQTNFENGFETHNAILDTTPYKPEVMIIGTFNPNTPNANYADFFYGRNHFWPAFKNLFYHNIPVILKRRMPTNGIPQENLNPSMLEIFNLCTTLKLTFSDLILEVLHHNFPSFKTLDNDNVIMDKVEYNLIQDGRKGNVYGLQQLNAINQVHWNTQNIINYLCNNPQIKTIYLTRRPKGIWAAHWDLIINHNCMVGRVTRNLFTPSGAGAPVYRSNIRLLNHWVHNNNQNFGQLDNNWLINNGVNTNNF